MTYIEAINAFWRWTSSNEISHAEVDLYFSILNIANTSNWKTRLSIPNSTLGRFDKNTLTRVRQSLVNKGLIQYQKGRKGQAPIYTINKIGINIIPENDTYNDTNNAIIPDFDTNIDTNSDTNNEPIMIPIQGTYIDNTKTKTRQDNITPIIPFDGILKEKTAEWLAYKKERRESYKETGLRALFAKIKNQCEQYGESTVISAMETAMANNWKGYFPKAESGGQAEYSVFGEDYDHDEITKLTRR